MSFTLVKGVDASTPPLKLPNGAHFIAGYIGGDTPHVWGENEWKRFKGIHKLPIFVRSNPRNVRPIDDAFIALRQLYHLRVPKGKVMALDFEATVDPEYVRRFWHAIQWGGYRLYVYGSTSTVFRNPKCNGYWPADYSDNPRHLYRHPGVEMTQYKSDASVDWDIAKRWRVMFRFWK